MVIDVTKIERLSQSERDQRIDELHRQAMAMWPGIEQIIDELKVLGPHSFDGDNALTNTQEWLNQLSKR